MFARLLLLFILVPIVELLLLIEIGRRVGTLPTVGLILITGALGAYLARRQGLQVLARVRSQTQTGQLPAEAIFDGALILVAGALLLTPGILTDIAGFLCLIPATRRIAKNLIRARLVQAGRNAQVFTTTYQSGGRSEQDEPENVIIIDPDDYETRS